MTGYKVFTHDYRSPVQGGDPVWDGTVPYVLPATPLDCGNSRPMRAEWRHCPYCGRRR